MAEEEDIGEWTLGELKERLKSEPELADRFPAIRRIQKMMEDLTRFPAIESLEKGFARFSAPPAAKRLPSSSDDDRPHPLSKMLERIPSPGDMELERMRMVAAAIAREVTPLKVKIAELTESLQKQSVSRQRPADLDLVGPRADMPAGSLPRELVPASPVVSKRAAGRPTRKWEIRRLLRERWRSGAMVMDGIAEEARQIERVLRERYKNGIQAGDPPIPNAETIENIIRKRYARLLKARNGVKYFIGQGPN